MQIESRIRETFIRNLIFIFYLGRTTTRYITRSRYFIITYFFGHKWNSSFNVCFSEYLQEIIISLYIEFHRRIFFKIFSKFYGEVDQTWFFKFSLKHYFKPQHRNYSYFKENIIKTSDMQWFSVLWPRFS